MTAIFTVLQAHMHDRNRVHLCATLIAAETDTEAEAIWRLWAARLIEAKLLRHALINANAADRVRLCSACDIEILDIEAFEHWRRIATTPYQADGKHYPAVWREIHSETRSEYEIQLRPEDEAENGPVDATLNEDLEKGEEVLPDNRTAQD
ncbi:hypothetical protein ACU4GI_21660 [Cupriavidus basilensis]